jgi:hypothetical protein
MAQTQLADVIVPAEFTAYQVENSLVSTALFTSGVAVRNGEMASQLQAGAQAFTVPFWLDLPDTEADITSDDPAVLSTPQKITANKQIVRKSFLHASWSEMSLASGLSGSSALQRIKDRVVAYWDRQHRSPYRQQNGEKIHSRRIACKPEYRPSVGAAKVAGTIRAEVAVEKGQ